MQIAKASHYLSGVQHLNSLNSDCRRASLYVRLNPAVSFSKFTNITVLTLAVLSFEIERLCKHFESDLLLSILLSERVLLAIKNVGKN